MASAIDKYIKARNKGDQAAISNLLPDAQKRTRELAKKVNSGVNYSDSEFEELRRARAAGL